MLVASVVGALAFGLSACGTSAPPDVASLGKTASQSSRTFHASNDIAVAEAQFGRCVRTHGVPNFPEACNHRHGDGLDTEQLRGPHSDISGRLGGLQEVHPG